MNWDAAGAIGEILGALAVVGTLLYLAIQIRVAQRSTNAELEDSINSAWSREIRAWGESEESARLMAEALSDYQGLTQEKKLMFHVRMDALMLEYQKQYHLYEQGAWDWPTRERIQSAVVRMLVTPGGRSWWEECGEIYLLQNHWNELIDTKGDELPPLNVYSWLKAPGA